MRLAREEGPGSGLYNKGQDDEKPAEEAWKDAGGKRRTKREARRRKCFQEPRATQSTPCYPGQCLSFPRTSANTGQHLHHMLQPPKCISSCAQTLCFEGETWEHLQPNRSPLVCVTRGRTLYNTTLHLFLCPWSSPAPFLPLPWERTYTIYNRAHKCTRDPGAPVNECNGPKKRRGVWCTEMGVLPMKCHRICWVVQGPLAPSPQKQNYQLGTRCQKGGYRLSLLHRWTWLGPTSGEDVGGPVMALREVGVPPCILYFLLAGCGHGEPFQTRAVPQDAGAM